jgi:hypothetical protein
MRLCTLSGQAAKSSLRTASRRAVMVRWSSGIACVLLAGCSASAGSGGGDPPVQVTVDEPEVEVPPPPPVATTPPTVDAPPIVDLGGDEVDPPAPRPEGLTFTQPTCSGGATTTISGTVHVPSGNMPLYNAMVYVPRLPLEPMPQGASCGCSVSGEPIVATITDADGRFVLENAPVGSDIPLVIQLGKWRREFNLGTVDSCTEHAVPEDTLRLPSNQTQGDMPKIAVSTGALDALECLLRKLGIDDSEFTNPELGGHVNLLEGYGGADRYSEELGGLPFWRSERVWDDVDRLKEYDVVLLSCDGARDYTDNKSPAAMQAMYDYANEGGRIFASHFHSVWFQRGPGDFPELANFLGPAEDNAFDAIDDVTADVVTAFPKGEALDAWLTTVEAMDAQGRVALHSPNNTIGADIADYAQAWIVTEDPSSVQYISANTPLGAPEAEQCGRVVLSDIHVSGGLQVDSSTRPPTLLGDVSVNDYPFPTGCVTTDLTPQEKVLAFMLFDISACVIPDSETPTFPSIR